MSFPEKLFSTQKLGAGQAKKLQTQRRKAKLFADQSGLCLLCGCEMFLSFEPPGKGTEKMNRAVLFHADGKFSSENGKHQGEERTFLMCRRCCEKESNKKQMQIPIETRREWSHGRFLGIAKPPIFTTIDGTTMGFVCAYCDADLTALNEVGQMHHLSGDCQK